MMSASHQSDWQFEVLVVSMNQVQEFLDARRLRFLNPETFQNARQALVASDKTAVLAHFETLLHSHDDEQRASAIEGLALLHGPEATDTIVRWINDSSSTVRWVVCGCLHDYGDLRAVPALLDRMKHDPDCQVRGVAASGLGQIGAIEALPDLHQAFQTDLEIDELGHSTSDQAQDAMTSVMKIWVSRQIQGTPPRTFRESTRLGHLTGTVTAEEVPFDADGRITHTSRYSHLPHSSFGHGSSSKMDLWTSLIAPFEIEVEYVDPTCVIQRILIYHQISGSAEVNWAVQTILDPTAMKSPPRP